MKYEGRETTSFELWFFFYFETVIHLFTKIYLMLPSFMCCLGRRKFSTYMIENNNYSSWLTLQDKRCELQNGFLSSIEWNHGQSMLNQLLINKASCRPVTRETLKKSSGHSKFVDVKGLNNLFQSKKIISFSLKIYAPIAKRKKTTRQNLPLCCRLLTPSLWNTDI